MGDELRHAKLRGYLQQQLGSSILPVQSEVDRAFKQGDLLNMLALHRRLAVQLARLAKAIKNFTTRLPRGKVRCATTILPAFFPCHNNTEIL